LASDLILKGEARLLIDEEKQRAIKKDIKKRREEKQKAAAVALRERLAPEQQRAMDVAQAKGGSCLVTVLPLEKYGFAFRGKRDFDDLIRQRYRKPIRRLPTTCPCGAPFSLDHSQICKLGGFVGMRHDEGKKIWAVANSKVFRDVEVEPQLEQLDDETLDYKTANRDQEARSDVRVRGFYGNQQNAFFDHKVFYPFALSYSKKSLASCFQNIEKKCRREYEQRINRVDNGSLTPMVMSSTGSMGPRMQIAVKHLAGLISEKRNEPYAKVMTLLRCQFAFAAMRSS
jgi:hypothetical protein